MIQRHHDVAADGPLRLDAELRAEQDRLPVEIALKDRALLAHRARMRQRENLEAARVRQHGALPAHEIVDAAGAPEDFRTRPQQQMISVREQNLRTGLLQRAGSCAFTVACVPTGMKSGVCTSLCRVRKVAARAREPVAWASR